jgi:hypothetical protein
MQITDLKRFCFPIQLEMKRHAIPSLNDLKTVQTGGKSV